MIVASLLEIYITFYFLQGLIATHGTIQPWKVYFKTATVKKWCKKPLFFSAKETEVRQE